MASPLQYFRKHQGYILAVLGVILIVTWVIGPSLSSLFESRPEGVRADSTSGVVAQWKLGKITRDELTTMEWEHDAVIRFLLAVVKRAQEDGVKPQAPFLNINQNQIDLGLPMQADDSTLVHIMLFAQKGKEMGIVFDQAAVMDYLTNLGGFALTEEDLRELARETVSQHRDRKHGAPLVTVSQLFDRLEVELTSRQAQAMILAGLTGFSTGELWEYHEQLHRRNKIEAFPIKVADYLGKFKESDAKEEELRTIYDKGKNRTPDPEYFEPGFRQPEKLAFGYVKVDFQRFLDAAKKNISEERLVEEYQKEIAAGNFHNLKFDAGDAAKTSDETAPPNTGDKKAGSEKTADEAKPAKSKPEEKAGEKTEKSKEPSPADDQSGKKAEENSEKPCQDEPAKDGAAKVEEKKEEASPAKKDEKKPADAAAAATEKPADSKPGETKAREPEFKPLSEVRDQLLNKLASPDARSASDAALSEIMRAVSDYGIKYTHWTEDKKAGGKTGAEDPGELKLNALAAKHDLAVGKTPLADRFAIAKTELGQQAAFRGVQGTVPFVEGAFFENRPLYAPQEASSISGETTFVYWRTAHEPSVQLPFDKARKQVAAAWIHQRAVEAAKKDAEALAAKGAKSASLKEVLTPDQAKQVIEPLPFTWLTRGASPLAFGGEPSFSEVNGIPLAGEEFMKEVFRLKVGETGVAVDRPHNTVYVVRVVAEEPSLDIRREMFLAGLQAGMFGDLISYARIASRNVMGEVVEELREEYQLKWVGTPRFGGEM